MSSRAKDDRTRRDTIEAMRRQQKTAERRKSLIIIGICSVLAIALIAVAAVPLLLKSLNDPAKKKPSAFGVSTASASCDAVTDDPVTDSTHVGPGTEGDKASVTRVDYKTVPPTSGNHFLEPDISGRHFYTAKDTPQLEVLVHNLEHGYNIVWYDATVKGKQLQALQDLAVRMPKDTATGPTGKFIVAAWDSSRGAFPAGKHVALAHWSAKPKVGTQFGHRELCGQVSGAVIAAFVDKYPASDAPEAGAQ